MATLTGISGGSGALANFAAFGNAGIAKFATLIPLIGKGTASGSGVYATLRRHGVLSGYQVPAGKKLVVVGALLRSSAGVNAEFGLGHGDTDVGFNSSSTPTNYMQNYVDFIPGINTLIFSSFMAVVPEGKYPYGIAAIGSGTWDATFHGYEIDAEATSI